MMVEMQDDNTAIVAQAIENAKRLGRLRTPFALSVHLDPWLVPGEFTNPSVTEPS